MSDAACLTGPPAPGTPEAAAQAKVSAAVVELMVADGVPPHIIAATLIANLTLVLCSSAPDVSTAHRQLTAAAGILKANRRLAPMLLRTARTTMHAAGASAATDKVQ